MKQKLLIFLSVIFTLSAISLIVIQIYQTRQSAAISDNMFNINVGNAMDAVIQQLDESRDGGQSINYHTLNELISEELLLNGIDFSPYVGILSSSMEELRYCNTPGKEELLLNSPFKYSFSPSANNLSDEVYIVLAFSSAALFLLRNAKIFVYMSIFLIAIIFGSFLMSIRIIFNQRKLDEMKTDFINNMTHEIKTPIATIGLACEMLNDKSINSEEEQRNNFITIISDENRRMRVLIETLLQSAKMSSKNFTISRKELSLNAVVSEVVKSFTLTISSRSGEMKVNLAAASSQIYGDELHLTNLIHNLIDNAIKYSSDTPYVEITTEETPQNVILRITDHGIGIAKEDQKHIFERFYRVSTGNVHNVKGFGIGLSYVAQIVALHQGKITLESEVGKGSTFIISFPKE